MGQMTVEMTPKESSSDADENAGISKRELKMFVFLTVILAPTLAVAIVGSYGLLIWIYQMLAGPPTGG